MAVVLLLLQGEMREVDDDDKGQLAGVHIFLEMRHPAVGAEELVHGGGGIARQLLRTHQFDGNPIVVAVNHFKVVADTVEKYCLFVQILAKILSAKLLEILLRPVFAAPQCRGLLHATFHQSLGDGGYTAHRFDGLLNGGVLDERVFCCNRRMNEHKDWQKDKNNRFSHFDR